MCMTAGCGCGAYNRSKVQWCKTTLVLAYPHSSSRQEHSRSHFGSGPFQYEQTASELMTTVLDS